ncbi:protein of unknown function [Streptomyces zhaozhouensis]|uniref:DUF4247 domain-containing protein n=1 Tax=Streptomyces zhaozhouensis TaxID=1300267 RepID=A0A286E7C9_9ACTN|nr:DUF4247 domain-containing protein [Streptomyces zhaozhouensis]SOD66781.1 protein of unknown function [Streptomyces zhaozhouensis]
MRNPRPRHVGVALVATTAFLLVGCSGGGSADAPRGWIAETYQRDTTATATYLDSADGPRDVADEIRDKAKPEDRIVDGDRIFLRYDDDIVAVSPHAPRGSRIEIEEYRRGVQRWHSHVGHRWSASQSDNFRGGGPGTGK